MMNVLRYGSIVVALMANVAIAAGQASPQDAAAQITLTPAQKSAVLRAVLQDPGRVAAPKSFQAAVGRPVPVSVPLRALPSGAATQSPLLYGKKYTMVQNQVVLIDPQSMRVIDILRQ